MPSRSAKLYVEPKCRRRLFSAHPRVWLPVFLRPSQSQRQGSLRLLGVTAWLVA
jgi:hypothetical protein